MRTGRQLEFFLWLTSLLAFLAGVLVAGWLLSTGGPTGGTLRLILTSRNALFLAAAFLFVLLLVSFVVYVVHHFVFTARRMAEETTIIATVNSSHRLTPDGPPPLRALAEAINTLADHFQRVQVEQESALETAHAVLQEEKERLAALVAQLTEGVLMCAPDGRVLLYNEQARRILAPSPQGHGGFVGLGRSVFDLLEASVLTHALEAVRDRLHGERPLYPLTFVTQALNGRFVRVRLGPVLGPDGKMSGFVLTLEDVTRNLETSSRRDRLVQMLTERSRAALANIRAAIETVEAYPQMDEAQRQRFHRIIREEAERLSVLLDETVQEYAGVLRARWRQEAIPADDLLAALRRQVERTVGVSVTVEHAEDVWLEVDSFAVVQALGAYLHHVCRMLAAEPCFMFHFSVERRGNHAALTVTWPDVSLDGPTLSRWLQRPLLNGSSSLFSVAEVAEQHGGTAWVQLDQARSHTKLVILLPVTPEVPEWEEALPVLESRPEYYDFDLLFRRSEPSPELDDRPLTELAYTVFDTETTGLDPDTDEIISLSAVRVVNGRLLRGEVFDQLVDPRRPLNPISMRVHRISPEKLKGQPTLEEVLPRFYRFAEGTVLVAHNAAFDLRFLRARETRAGVAFTNPVLDTLLLSAVVHPAQEDHSLEAIARRLGVPIMGRHTSLGDALITAQVFLKLIPLLAQQGIHTLGEARRASEETYFARIRY